MGTCLLVSGSDLYSEHVFYSLSQKVQMIKKRGKNESSKNSGGDLESWIPITSDTKSDTRQLAGTSAAAAETNRWASLLSGCNLGPSLHHNQWYSSTWLYSKRHHAPTTTKTISLNYYFHFI